MHMSVCLSRRLTAAAACGGFAAVGPAGRQYQSIAARPICSRPFDPHPQQHGSQQQL